MTAETATEPSEIAAFAAELRSLRLQADSPTLTRLQSDTGISKTVLSDAFAGRKLPSARTVDRLVRACGADPAEWILRRDGIADRLLRDPASDGAGPDDDASGTARPRRSGRRSAVWWAIAAFVVGSAVSGATASLVVSNAYEGRLAEARAALTAAQDATDGRPDAAAPQLAVTSGEDPATTPCVDDAAVAASENRVGDTLLQIVWSDKCQAGWGRITRYDGLAEGNTVSIAIYPETSPDGPDRQEATEHDVQGAYTTLVVRPTADTRLCAVGAFTVDGVRTDLGDPICL